MDNTIRVRVPATTANLGAGFDTLGLAFKLYNTFTFEEKKDGKLTIRGVPPRYQNESNLVYRAMLEVFKRVSYRPKGLYIHSETEVPVGRGLGSSATCIVAGLVAANLMTNTPLEGKKLYDIAVEMEGHPDNITPAMFGGLVAAASTYEETFYYKKEVHDSITFYGIIPDFNLPTREAREALPKRVSHKDAVFNISRATMTYLALIEGDLRTLGAMVDDKLHQRYRKKLIHRYDDVTKLAGQVGAIATCISGAGPTILAMVPANDDYFAQKMTNYLNKELPNWQLLHLEPDNVGVCVG